MKTEDLSKAGTPRWGMVIDLNRCVGCQTCTIACKHANDTAPDVQWRRVLDVEQGTFPDVERFFLVTGCQHCAEPPCVPVCPTGATRQREDGLVTQDYDICIGCAYCVVSCPYQARTIMHEPRSYYGKATRQEEATAHPERLGVAQKCTFCKERIDDGVARGLKPGVDPEASPACASACISQAIQFGDFNDPASHVSDLLRERPSVQLNAELGTDPQIKYLYTTPAVPGRETGAAPSDDERLADPANPLVGPLQSFWDWRAAMNWIFGGAGTGLAMASALAYLAGRLAPRDAATAMLAAAALVATGLFCVFLKIGRKLRFWRAATRLQSSWMTRELYATPFFFAGALWSALAPSPLPVALAGLGAAAFLACQAKILHRARGIPAWRAPLIPWMIFATGLAEGAGAFAVLGSPGRPGLAALAGLVALNLVLWRAYVGSAKAAGMPPLSRRALDEISPWLHAVGHALPLALIAVAWFAEPRIAGFLAMGAGAAVLFGGVLWKFRVVVRAGYFQGFGLPRVPQRGSGRLAAPPRFA